MPDIVIAPEAAANAIHGTRHPPNDLDRLCRKNKTLLQLLRQELRVDVSVVSEEKCVSEEISQ